MRIVSKISSTLVLFLTGALYCLCQDLHHVQGVVSDVETKSPLAGVSIVVDGLRVAMTDSDGRYDATVGSDAVLFFYATGYNGYKTSIDGRQEIDVQLSEMVISLGEAIVVGQMSRKTIVVDQTELEVIGNYLHLKTKFRVPKRVFRSDRRFIVQPSLVNVTRDNVSWFRPVVIDGEEYDINRERMCGFEPDPDDVLRPYIVENDLASTFNVYSYHDSLFVASECVDNDYRSECYLAVNSLYEDVRHDYLDTVVIAKGTVNPLRFFRYDIPPLPLMDSTLIPRPRMELVNERGVSRISFLVGRAVIDSGDAEGMRELSQVKERISSILSNPFATLKSVSVTGYASPEGTYSKNLSLASERTRLVLNEVTSSIPESVKSRVMLDYSSVVQPWSSVASLLESDSVSCAPVVRGIVQKYGDDFVRSQSAVKQLKEYRSLIVPEYLPRLRRVEYEIGYSMFRNLTDEEIWQRHRDGRERLTRHEYWRLIETSADSASRVSMEREALAAYPDFTLIANREAVRCLEGGKADLSVLAPSLSKDCPYQLIYNQTLMSLALGESEKADSLARLLPQDDRFVYLKSVVDVRNGRFDESYPVIASKGGLNEALVLMCMGKNDQARDCVQKLLESPSNKHDAQMWYILAACANRMDDLGTSMDALQCALTLDPSLEELARLDSDVMDILDIIKPEE